MTTALERPALTDEIEAALKKADSLVDTCWGTGSLWQAEGKTCLLGLIALSVDAPLAYDTFGDLDHYHHSADGEGHPVAKRVAEYVASRVPDDGSAVQSIYRFNDDHLKTPEDAHLFLQELVEL